MNKLIFTDSPSFIAFHRKGVHVAWNHYLKLGEQTYRLCGLIYYKDFHFTCRIISPNGSIWYNDGIQTGSSSRYEAHIDSMHSELLQSAPSGRKISVIVYSLAIGKD